MAPIDTKILPTNAAHPKNIKSKIHARWSACTFTRTKIHARRSACFNTIAKHIQPYATIHSHTQRYTTIHTHIGEYTSIVKHIQPPAAIYNVYSRIHSHIQPYKEPFATIYSHIHAQHFQTLKCIEMYTK